jgi:periplasmic protein TonB
MVAVGMKARDRMVAGLGTAIVLALFGYMLVRGLTVGFVAVIERPMELLDLRTPPPPPRPKPRIEPKQDRPAHAASPDNLRAKATPVVVPPLAPPPIIAAP